MADRSIGSELNEVRKKLNDIERKQEFLEKVIQLERFWFCEVRQIKHVRE